MKIVIDIPEEIYRLALKSGYSHLYDEEVANAVSEGKPLTELIAEMQNITLVRQKEV